MQLKHPDYKPLRDAVHAMRGMAAHVNECKRRTEGLVKLSVFQAGILDWEVSSWDKSYTSRLDQGPD